MADKTRNISQIGYIKYSGIPDHIQTQGYIKAKKYGLGGGGVRLAAGGKGRCRGKNEKGESE